MPDPRTDHHLESLRRFQRDRGGLLTRLVRAAKAARQELVGEIYGMEWGDPEAVMPLRFVHDHYVLPYVRNDRTALEVGPGGGRWTRYLLGFRRLVVVDCYEEVLDELKRTYNKPNMQFVKNDGTNFPDVTDASVDFVFSFGTFIFLDLPLIEAYLGEMKRVLKPNANVVIHYGDKTKIMARAPIYADNDRKRMCDLVVAAGYRILEEDLTTLWLGNIIRFAPVSADGSAGRGSSL